MSFSSILVNNPISKGVIAVIKGDYKYIFQLDDKREELYNIRKDPCENKNLLRIKKDKFNELKQLVESKLLHKR